eukprot:3120349-Rhodomonas_salina.2
MLRILVPAAAGRSAGGCVHGAGGAERGLHGHMCAHWAIAGTDLRYAAISARRCPVLNCGMLLPGAVREVQRRAHRLDPRSRDNSTKQLRARAWSRDNSATPLLVLTAARWYQVVSY